MLKSPVLKYVVQPQKIIYMPPLLAGVSVAGGMFLWFFGVAAGFGPIPGIMWGILGSLVSIYLGIRDDHLHDVLLSRQKFMSKKPVLHPTKGHLYVG